VLVKLLTAMMWSSLQGAFLSGHVRNSKVVFESRNIEKNKDNMIKGNSGENRVREKLRKASKIMFRQYGNKKQRKEL